MVFYLLLNSLWMLSRWNFVVSRWNLKSSTHFAHLQGLWIDDLLNVITSMRTGSNQKGAHSENKPKSKEAPAQVKDCFLDCFYCWQTNVVMKQYQFWSSLPVKGLVFWSASHNSISWAWYRSDITVSSPFSSQ